MLLLVSFTILSFMTILQTGIGADVNTVEYWNSIIEELGSGDVRMFRWDAKEETVEKQLDENLCGKAVMEQAFGIITNNENSHSDYQEVVARALEYLTWCVTDNPTNRELFASHEGIHKAVLDWIFKFRHSLTNDDDTLHHSIISAACHVVYTTTFANAVNHQAYINAGATYRLAYVIKHTAYKSSTSPEAIERQEEQFHLPYPPVTMWSLAALANLAASYCDTEGDGRCYWSWAEDGSLALDPESGNIVSSGEPVRTEVINDESLMQLLVDISCLGPVSPDNEEEVSIGVNAEINRDEESPNIVVWAAASVLKNIAIDPASHPILEDNVSCFCYLSNSVDWLEENKGAGVLYHLRRGYPCWFAEAHSEEGDVLGHSLCIDHPFYHEEHFTCSDYDKNDPTEEECNVSDRNDVLATDACCACGGGDIITTGIHDEVEGEEEVEDEL